jgi:hypothetical protein
VRCRPQAHDLGRQGHQPVVPVMGDVLECAVLT